MSLERCTKNRRPSEPAVETFREESGIVALRLQRRRGWTKGKNFRGPEREASRGDWGTVLGTNNFDDWNGPLAGRRLRERLGDEFEGFLRKDITRTAGIEPTQTVLKTVVLPLNYAPKC